MRAKTYKTNYDRPIMRFSGIKDSNVNSNLDERAKKYWASKNYKKEDVSYELTSTIKARIP